MPWPVEGVAVAPGSNFLILALAHAARRVLDTTPSFAFYEGAAKLSPSAYRTVPLQVGPAGFALPVEALRESTPGADKPSKRRAVIGLTIVSAGVAAILSSLYGGASYCVRVRARSDRDASNKDIVSDWTQLGGAGSIADQLRGNPATNGSSR